MYFVLCQIILIEQNEESFWNPARKDNGSESTNTVRYQLLIDEENINIMFWMHHF